MDVLGIPAALHIAQTACVSASCQPPQLTPDQLRQLAASGMSPDFYGAYIVALNWLSTLVFVLVAVIIVARRSADRMALFAAFMLLTFGGATAYGTMAELPGQNSLWWLPVNLASITGQVAYFLFFCLFPSGRFVPRWIRWVVLVEVLVQIAAVIPLPALQTFAGGILPLAVLLGILIVAQVYRFRRVSTPVERQQTKWVVLGFVAGIGIFIALILYGNLTLGPGAPDTPQGTLVANTVLSVLICFVPISIGVAILRSGLWDVDVIINRTLVYGSLTLLLALVYFGSVIGLQQVVRLVSGQQAENNPLAIVLSTLLIAALFQLLRRRVQATIDRRFFRSRYDATKTLEGFAATLRGEIELASLGDHLVGVVEETMQPAHVSLWLRPPQRG
jgi:hypothetical protein